MDPILFIPVEIVAQVHVLLLQVLLVPLLAVGPGALLNDQPFFVEQLALAPLDVRDPLVIDEGVQLLLVAGAYHGELDARALVQHELDHVPYAPEDHGAVDNNILVHLLRVGVARHGGDALDVFLHDGGVRSDPEPVQVHQQELLAHGHALELGELGLDHALRPHILPDIVLLHVTLVPGFGELVGVAVAQDIDPDGQPLLGDAVEAARPLRFEEEELGHLLVLLEKTFGDF